MGRKNKRKDTNKTRRHQQQQIKSIKLCKGVNVDVAKPTIIRICSAPVYKSQSELVSKRSNNGYIQLYSIQQDLYDKYHALEAITSLPKHLDRVANADIASIIQQIRPLQCDQKTKQTLKETCQTYINFVKSNRKEIKAYTSNRAIQELDELVSYKGWMELKSKLPKPVEYVYHVCSR